MLVYAIGVYVMLQKYQFELRDCSHISSCHKEAEISLAKSTKPSNLQ
jgi:hypothetical protein